MKRVFVTLSLSALLVGLGTASPAFAQNWMTDARRIGMGGVGGSENLASKMVESPEGVYSTIVIPLGLFQVLEDIDIYDPNSEKFDPIRATEYAVAPLHYTWDRNGTGTGIEFINDLLDGRLNRDLNTYKTFVPTTQPVGYGLWAPSWGVTIPVYKKKNGTLHAVYVGAGPYLPFRGSIEVDERLQEILDSDTNMYVPNTSMRIVSGARVELPLAVTGGYRGRYQLWESRSDRDGLYVAFNYNYLRGFRYEDIVMTLRLDTDSQGLLTFNPNAPGNPVDVLRLSSSEGRGHAMDFGVAAVVNRIEFGFGMNGIANQITWKDVESYRYSLTNILTGDGDFIESPVATVADVEVEQPVEYVGNAGYHANRWQVAFEVGTRSSNDLRDEGRLGKTWFHTGFEYRFGLLEPRAGVFYSRDSWRPAVGVGLNFGKWGIDAAAYSNDSNVEHVKHPSLALSIRLGSRDRQVQAQP